MGMADNLDVIQKQIDAASPIIEKIGHLITKPTRPVYGDISSTQGKRAYDKMTVTKIEEEVNRWQYATKKVLAVCFGSNSEHYKAFADTIVDNQGLYLDAKVDLHNEVSNGRSTLSAIIEAENLTGQIEKQVEDTQKSLAQKPPKVFISHKKEDKAYADALVSLINFIIGTDGDKIFCSSVQGYGIRQSRDIMDELKAQYDNHEIFMVIIHSPRYYRSAICLNEMGAAWVMGSRFSSFLTKDCKPDDMRGVINKEKIFIDLNDDADQLNAHLNDFKDDLVDFFHSNRIDANKWENTRSRFINEVGALSYDPVVACKDVDLFDAIYLPAFERIFNLLDLNHYQAWAYRCAIAGNTILRAQIYDNLGILTQYILSRPKHKEFVGWDTLLRNLALLVDDFETVYSQYAEKLDDGNYVVERFYKKYPNNPRYEEDLSAYNEHIMLVSDMLFELTRLLNLVLSRIRDIYPEYKKEIGILRIDNRVSTPDLIYKDNEISDAPYPGLREYIKVRLTREIHYGSKPDIDASGN